MGRTAARFLAGLLAVTSAAPIVMALFLARLTAVPTDRQWRRAGGAVACIGLVLGLIVVSS